jgi:hypothetical protein
MANRTHPTTATWTLMAVASLLAIGSTTGCKSDKAQPAVVHGEEFVRADATRNVGCISQAQAASGAKADGMLYDRNFHGEKLNSLGMTKLDLIVKGTPAGDPVVVYLNVPQDGLETRRPAVLAYLKEGGLKEEQIKLIDGSNPTNTTPSAMSMSKLYKSTNGTYTGELAESADSVSAAAGGGGSMGASSGSK